MAFLLGRGRADRMLRLNRRVLPTRSLERARSGGLFQRVAASQAADDRLSRRSGGRLDPGKRRRVGSHRGGNGRAQGLKEGSHLMAKRLRPSPALIIAVIALFVSIG